MKSKTKIAIAVAIVFIAAAVANTSCDPYKVAWTTMDGILKARNVSAAALAEKGKIAHEKCLKVHEVKTQGYADCIKPWRDALTNWGLYGRPGLTSPVRVAAVSVDIAKAKGNKNFNWGKVLAQCGCALSGIGSDWSIHIPNELKTINVAIKGLGTFTCPKSAWTDILGPIGVLIGWLAKTLGEPTEVIRKRVKEVLSEPLSDDTDQVLATINASMPPK